jgi:hypothetical protein
MNYETMRFVATTLVVVAVMRVWFAGLWFLIKPGGMKHFFMVMAIENMRTFGAIIARIMPLHVQPSSTPAYMTEEQAIAELKMYGLPPGLINICTRSMRTNSTKKLAHVGCHALTVGKLG